MAEAESIRNGKVVLFDRSAMSRRLSFLVLICLGIFFAACSSKAKVKYESLDRKETQDKINAVGNSAEAAELFKKLSDQLSEEERKPLNEMISVIIDRTPSKAEKNFTVVAVLKAAESIRSTATLRANFKNLVEQMLELSKFFDESLKAIADGLAVAAGENKTVFLSQAEFLRKRAIAQTDLLLTIESLLSKVNSEGVLASSGAWGSLPADVTAAKDYLEILFKIAASASAQDVAKWIDRTKDENISALLLQGIRPISANDSQLPFMVKVQNVIPQDTLLIFNSLMAVYTSDATAQNTKVSLAEALKKSLVLKSALQPSFFALTAESLKRTNSQIFLNALADSIDRTGGEGFFLQPQYTTRNLSAFVIPGCVLPGSSGESVTFSFSWKKSGNVILEFTPPSTVRQNSAGVLFEVDAQAQCSVRVFVSGNQVAELNSELVTVRSAAPSFASGDPPIVQSFAIKKSGSFLYKVNEQDAIADINTFYRVTTQPQHGSVSQSEVGFFDYRPIANYVGADSFGFVACNPDDVCSSEKLITFNISEGNLSPQLERFIIPPQNKLGAGIAMSQSSVLTDVQVVVIDDDILTSSCAVPNVIVTSGNLAVIPQANIEISGTYPFCKLKLTPAAGPGGLGSATLTLKLDDQINPPVTSDFNVTVFSSTPQFVLPEAPTTFTVNKNSGANTLQLSALVDPDAALFTTPQTTTYSVTSSPALGSVSAASTVPAAGFGSITYTTPSSQPNTQANQTTSFSYLACDNSSTPNCSPTRTVSVNIINNPPTISAIGDLSFNEDTLSTVQSFTISDPDDTRSCADFNSAGNKISSDTTIIPTSGIIVGGTGTNCTVQIDSEANGSGGPVTVTLSLPHTVPVQRSFSVTVLPVNDAPTAVQLSNATIVENNLANAFIGTLSTTDPDSDDSFTYTLGGADAAAFTISGSNLLINAPADFDTKSSFAITITSTDADGLSIAGVPFTITVININESPAFTSTGETLVQVSEQEVNRTITLATATDADNPTLTAELVGSGPSSGTLTGFPVTLTSGGTAQTVTYAPTAGQLGVFTFQYRVCDAAPLCTEVKTVSIEVLGKTPVLNGAALNSSFNVETSESVSIALDGVIDPDAVRLAQSLSYTVTLTNSLGTAPTGFAAATTGTGSVTFTAGASSGVEVLKYKACDSNATPNCSSEKSVTINIGTANSPFEVTAGSRSVAIGNANTGTVTLGQFADPITPAATLVYVVTQNAARLSSVSGLNPATGTQTVTYSRPDQSAGTEVVAYKACTTGVTPQRCSPEIVVEVSRTTDIAAPTLAGGDSLVVISETAGTGGGSVNISLAGATSAGHPEFTLTYSLVQGPQNRTGVALVDGPVATLATLPANANATTTTVSYTLRNDLFAGTSDQIIYQVCQNSTPILCSSRTVSIAVIAANDPTTGTISTLDSNTPPLKLTGAESGSKTFNMNLTLADSDSIVACNSVTVISSAPSLIAASTVSEAGPCTFTLTSTAGLSGDADITLQLGGSTMKINADQTSFRTSVLALDNSSPKRAIHVCNGSSVIVGQGPDSSNQSIDGIAACKDFVDSGWDATVALNENQYFRSIDRSKLPDPRNYCIGFKLFGFQGMALCGNGSEPLNLHRNVGTLLVNASTEPATGYRLFPDPVKDHDGQTVGTSGIKKLLTRPANPCGTSGATVASRIVDCSVQNPTTSFWDGSVKGNTGQGLWRLVTVKAIADGDCASGCTEVWRDERTGLLWSDVIVDNSADAVDTYNWCKASGNSNAADAPSQEIDATVCASAANQNQTTPTSVCAEDDVAPSVFALLDARQLLSLGDLRLNTTPKVRWWLPSRADYLRAERHGLRFVLPNFNNEFWTATVSSAASGNAWTFDGGAGGKLSTAARTASKKVRCVGSP